MAKEITKQDDVITPDTITKEDVKKLICATATDKEITMFLQIAKLNQLNYFKREIYLVKYKADTPASILTGYEVYLKRAERSGNYLGFKVWIEGAVPDMKACIEVRRKDWKDPLYHEVDYAEYVQKRWDKDTRKMVPNKFWKEKPKTMLKKVCISQGLRFAFPDELAGMPYVREEIDTENVIDVQANGKPSIKAPEAIEEAKPEPNVLPAAVKSEAASTSLVEPKVTEPEKSPEHPKEPQSKPLGYTQRFIACKQALGSEDYFYALKKAGYKGAGEIPKSKVDEVLESLEKLAIVEETFEGEI